MYIRPLFKSLFKRLSEPRQRIHLLAGPRHAGKTTLARQLADTIQHPCVYASADEPALKDAAWIERQWDVIRTRVDTAADTRPGLIILDEVHRIPGWCETVGRLWDEDGAAGRKVKTLLIASAPLLVQQALAGRLAGKFETTAAGHWSLGEMREAFGWSLEQYLFFGGYPGAALLADEHGPWSRSIKDSLVETTLSRDVLLLARLYKPALLRGLFELGCLNSGRVLSYHKMLGRLHDAGNTTTLAHYLALLQTAGLVMGLPKYAGRKARLRASSPKLLALNTALMTAMSGRLPGESRLDTDFWGRLVETAVGAHLAGAIDGSGIELFYWSARNREVDYVLAAGRRITVVEARSGRRRDAFPGLDVFSREFKVTRTILVGPGGVALEDFLLADPKVWL